MKNSFTTLLRRGDPFIWLTSTGLAVSLVMVVSLIGLIVINGIGVFWPAQIARVSVTTEGQLPEIWLGKIVTKRDKANFAGLGVREWQMYVGNRDVTGASFRFLNESQVRGVDYPDNLLVLERMEFGDAIGYPIAFVDGTTKLKADDSDFYFALDKAVVQASELRTRISLIEKKEIGAVNARMESLRIDAKRLSGKDNTALAAIVAEQHKLEEVYLSLAASAKNLRAQEKGCFLVLGLASGAEHVIPLENIVRYTQPNRLGFFGRFGEFFYKISAFLREDPREANTEGGIFPAIFGTLVMTILMSLAVTPFGVLAAIYLREYARQGTFVRAVRIAVNNLAGVPSIVFGIFGVGFFVYTLGTKIDEWFFSAWLPTPTFGTGGILWAALTLALLTVPVVIVSTEEALAAVPRGMREGSLACGASKWQTIQRIVLPASTQGILTGMILAMARGAGEVAPLMLVGVVKLAPSLPIDGTFPYFHLDQKFMHLGFHIYDLGFQSPDSEAAKPMVFATTLFLICMVVLMNLAAIIIRERLRKKYASGVF